jgi:hypothetical protein
VTVCRPTGKPHSTLHRCTAAIVGDLYRHWYFANNRCGTPVFRDVARCGARGNTASQLENQAVPSA